MSTKNAKLTLPLPPLPLIQILLIPLLPLNLRHQPLILGLIRSIPLLLLPQLLARDEGCVLAQLAHRPLALALVLLLQLGAVGALAVRVVVLGGIKRLLELWNPGGNGERPVVVQGLRATDEAGVVQTRL